MRRERRNRCGNKSERIKKKGHSSCSFLFGSLCSDGSGGDRVLGNIHHSFLCLLGLGVSSLKSCCCVCLCLGIGLLLQQLYSNMTKKKNDLQMLEAKDPQPVHTAGSAPLSFVPLLVDLSFLMLIERHLVDMVLTIRREKERGREGGEG